MFQSALIESSSTSSRRTLRLPLSVAALLHGAAGLIILGASFCSVGDNPDPPAQIVFVEPRVPPAAGAPSPARGGASSARRTAHPLVQPVEIPREIPAREENVAGLTDSRASEAHDGAAGDASLPGGTGEGSPDGVPGGLGERDAVRDPVIPASSATEMPVLTLRVDPAYPESARRIHAEGQVVLQAVISATGVVEEARVIQSANPLLDRSALQAVEQWRYRPAKLNGRAVRVALVVTVRFSLH
jgi:TonB family protein